MGFLSTANTLTLTANLTPLGRQKLVSTNNALFASFSLGDSDANYNTPLTLQTGSIPSNSGYIGTNGSISNSTAQNVAINNPIIVNANGITRKSVETQSSTISIQQESNGFITISGTDITHNAINRNNYLTDPLVNLFYSFKLSLNNNDDINYTGVTFSNGGFSDTTLSGLAVSNILVFGINNTKYGECIDGKSIKIDLPTSAKTYTIYSTYENIGVPLTTEDGNIRETSSVTEFLGSNIAILFSDDIMKPNGGNTTLSWGTGYGTIKPFSINKKMLYNLQTNSNIGLTADTMVGVAYLDKGFVVITNPQIISDYNINVSSGITITYDSVSTAVYQNITCIANRGEFGISTNSTFSETDIPRISEIGLYDNIGNLLAYGKTDRQITKNINEFLALSVKINI